VQRPAKFVKYMRNYGYEATVLTAANPSVPLRDESITDETAEGAIVLKARTLEPSYRVKESIVRKGNRRLGLKSVIRSILIPDPQVLWIPGLIKKVFSMRRLDRPDLIFVTAPPFSSLVAGVLAKTILKRPLVSDFRDEWVGWLAGSSWTELGTNRRIRTRIERFLEHFVVRHSDAVVSASPGYVEPFKKKYSRISASKFSAITNGYDAEDFASEASSEGYDDLFLETKFNVLYMGTVFSLTSLKYFLEGVASAEARKDLNLVVVGRITSEEEEVLDSHADLSIKRLGYVPHAQAIQIARHADALLLTLSPIDGAEKIIPGKMFEYLALKKHVIAVMPLGVASAILGDFSGCMILEPTDRASIGHAYQSLSDKWRNHVLCSVENDVLAHSRQKKTEALCTLFDKVLHEKGRGSRTDLLTKTGALKAEDRP
jgi:hypothetical protein